MHMELAPNYSAEIALSYGCKRNDVMQCNQCVLGMRTRSHYSGISMIRGYWYLHFLHDKGLICILNPQLSETMSDEDSAFDVTVLVSL